VRLEPVVPKVAGLLAEAEDDLIAFYAMPAEHWSKLRSTNPLERVNREIGRHSDVVGILPQRGRAASPSQLLADRARHDWLVGRRYLSEGSMALVLGRGEIEPERLTAPALSGAPAAIAHA
jgi:transposase-like protein